MLQIHECSLCSDSGGELIYKNEEYRVIWVNDPDYPGFIRIILNQHFQEMTDLPLAKAVQLFKVIFKVELVIREVYHPDKINLASLGNLVPHLHWHIIPRYFKDKHFPNPIWGEVTNSSYIPEPWLLLTKGQLFDKLNQILAK